MTDWFEELYAAADKGEATVPWDLGAPSRQLTRWAADKGLSGTGRSALVVGCGLGRDAEYIAGLGFDTTAFDISPTAVATARRRYPDSAVRYLTADLLDPPPAWERAYDLVVESMTVQSLPDGYRPTAIANVGRLVAPDGTLVVLAAARDEADGPVDGPPWPLTRAEVDAFATGGLRPVDVEELDDPVYPGIRRWQAEFRRAPAG